MSQQISTHFYHGPVSKTSHVAATMVGIAIFFLPFTYALTIYVGFPLKVYEVALPIAALATLVQPKIVGSVAFFRILAAMIILVTIVAVGFVFNAVSPASEILEDESLRFGGPLGRIVEGVAKTLYLLFVVISFLVIYQQSRRAPRLIVAAWLYGAAVSAGYLVYLNLAVNLGFNVAALPGILRHQQIEFSGFTFIRSGTFEEGNFAALYFLFSMAISLTYRRFFLAGLFLLATAFTMSTIGMIGVFLLLCLLVMMPRAGGSMVPRVLAAMLAVTLFSISVASGYLDYVAEEKFSFERPGSFVDRLNDVVTGSSIFLENPFVGVGLAQYGYHFDQHKAWDDLVDTHEGKRIPNNVYVELLAETGILGVVAFLSILYLVIQRLRRSQMIRPLLAANLSAVVVLNAFPTFTMMYLWAFWAVALALRDSPTRAIFDTKKSISTSRDIVQCARDGWIR